MSKARPLRRAQHSARGETVASERSSGERREDVVRRAPQTLRLLFLQLSDERRTATPSSSWATRARESRNLPG